MKVKQDFLCILWYAQKVFFFYPEVLKKRMDKEDKAMKQIYQMTKEELIKAKGSGNGLKEEEALRLLKEH